MKSGVKCDTNSSQRGCVSAWVTNGQENIDVECGRLLHANDTYGDELAVSTNDFLLEAIDVDLDIGGVEVVAKAEADELQ